MRAATPFSARIRAATMTSVAVVLIPTAGLTACSEGKRESTTGKPAIVASTDVWGSVAKAVAGDDADVRSIIRSGSADPHSYEASPADAAALSDASLVVYNGGGYDAWVDDVLNHHPKVPAVDAYSLLDAAAIGEPTPANEHVFYELGTAKAVATQIADRLAAADTAHADQYRDRAEEFGKKADAIRASESAIGTAHPGTAVVATEPVAHFLLHAAGLTDKTPAGFTAATEQDTDPAPVDIAGMLDLITEHQVAALVFNDQTLTAATKKVRAAAEHAGLPVVIVTETLPADSDYLDWQADTVNRLAAALRG